MLTFSKPWPFFYSSLGNKSNHLFQVFKKLLPGKILKPLKHACAHIFPSEF